MSASSLSESCDAILIGGGPAGATAAAILAEYGHRVLVLEREKFPRYHIGESLIPFTYGPLQRIGMIPKMKASHFVKKYSVTFVQPKGDRSQPFYFFTRYAFLDPVFSSGVMLALKSGHLAGEAIHEGLLAGDLSPARFAGYGATIRQGVENMRKLVYAFYDPAFSFREVIKRHPEAAGLMTDCLSGDVNKDFTQLWDWVRELVPLPDDLPYREPLEGVLTPPPPCH